MPRSVVLGNGHMLVNMDKKGLIHDFYFPYVGMEDHTTFGHYHRIGIFEEESGNFTWLDDDHWYGESKYLPETLVSETKVKSNLWNLEITFIDCVHAMKNILIREIYVKNHADSERKLRIFFNFDFHLYGIKSNDTVYYYPKGNYLMFYKFNRYFLVNGESDTAGIQQYATGKSEFRGLEGTWRDAEDGVLGGHPIEQGSVDATFGLHTMLGPHQCNKLRVWICAGENEDEVEILNANVFQRSTDEMIDYTKNYWRNWVNKQDFNFEGVPEKIRMLFKQSLLLIRSQIDQNGAILAANDTDIMKFNKDTYSYMWPRDGALVAHALDSAGYIEVTKRFFEFCRRIQTAEGYLRQKYNPDGSVGSTWHPWLKEDPEFIPLQADETALIIIALWNHYQHVHDIEFMQAIAETFVIKAANFLCQYKNKEDNLPNPCYDLWEEQRGIFTWTVATIVKALECAAELLNTVGHDRHYEKYMKEAALIKDALLKNMYCEKHETFVKKLTYNEQGELVKDYTADASISGIWLFDVLPPTDMRVMKTMRRIKEKLSVKTDIGGIARYERDGYHAIGDYPTEVPGNPWIITTLWISQWLMHISKDRDDENFKEAIDLINWATDQADTTFVLPEQINPYTGQHLSVAPLTWSHATYVDTIMLYSRKLKEFGITEKSILPERIITVE
ncbi:glycoside hydrolase family 15 protein [Candidatus Peregrinibacteria bacterium]|nr:glycoside hydrolase family 15 protein [Candidatus Peregrinibacteria bacterium]